MGDSSPVDTDRSCSLPMYWGLCHSEVPAGEGRSKDGEGTLSGKDVKWVIPTRKEVHRSTSSVFLVIFLKWPNSHDIQLVHSESQHTSQLMWVLSNHLDHLSF